MNATGLFRRMLRKSRTVKTRVLVAVKSLRLHRVIEHLLHARRDLKVLARVEDRVQLPSALRRQFPRIVIADAAPIGLDFERSITVLKRSHPDTKLLVICSVSGFAREMRRRGADACLAEEALVKRLLPTVSVLAGSAH